MDKKRTLDLADKFQRFCNAAVTIIMIILTGYLFLISIFNTSMINFAEIIFSDSWVACEKTVYLTDNPLVHIAAISLIFLCGYLINVRIHTPSEKMMKRILITIHIIVFFVMFISIFLYVYEPVFDQYTTLKATYNLINSWYYDWQIGGVNYVHSWMNSLVLFFTIPVYLFGMHGSLIAIRIFNLVMFILASYSFYGFCKETKLNSVAASLIFVLYLPASLYVFFIYGNMAGMSLSVFAIWKAVCYLNHKCKKDAILCALSIVAAALFKDHALIVFIAILIVIGIYGIISRSWKQLLWLVVFITLYMGSCMVVDTVIESVTGEEIPNAMDVYGHLYMGICEGELANGWYNDADLSLLSLCNFDFEQYKPISKSLFQMRWKSLWNDPSYAINFFAKKTASQWNNPTFQGLWILQRMLLKNTDENIESRPSLLLIDGSFPNMLFYYIYNLIQSLVLFGSLCYFVFESKKAPLSSLIPAIAFIGGFIFLFFWEAKAQYTLMFFVMLFPYVTTGFQSLYRGLTGLTDPEKRKKWYQSGKVIFLEVLLLLVLLISVADTPFFNDTMKLGTDDEYYNEFLEASVYYFGEIYDMD